MREGYTTGSCAAAAAKAAAYMLFTKEKTETVRITVPRGDVFYAQILDISLREDSVKCAVKKDAGDDPDVTDGLLIYAEVRRREDGDAGGKSDRPDLADGSADKTGECSADDSDDPPGECRADDSDDPPGECSTDDSADTPGECSADGSADTPGECRADDVEINSTNAMGDGKGAVSIRILGGEGVGRVTKGGLDQKIGEYAINSVPRQMIKEAVSGAYEEASAAADLRDFYLTGIDVIISVPGGEEAAKRTFNERLGIVGGISIIGTSGIVEPMSRKAVIDTIRLELGQYHDMYGDSVVISPGNYGQRFLMDEYGFDIDKAVKCSNFIGETIESCVDIGFKNVLICGHVGKLIKLGAGIMNTHSHEADARMEVLSAAGIRLGLDNEMLNRILDANTTTEALRIIGEDSLVNIKQIMSLVMERIIYYLDMKCRNRIKCECMIYCDGYGLLAASYGAEALLDDIMNNMNTGGR